MNATPPLHAAPTSGAEERSLLDARPLSPEQQRDRLLRAVARGFAWLGVGAGLTVLGLGLFHPHAAPRHAYLGVFMVISCSSAAFGLSRRWAPWLIAAWLLSLVLTALSFSSVF